MTVPFFDPEQLRDLRSSLEALQLAGDGGFFDTASAGLPFEQRQLVHRTLCSAFAEPASRLLDRYRPIMSSLLTKWPGSDSAKEIHRDFRLVDESRFRSVCIWVPLIDVDRHNGALAVLPGSHRVPSGPRSVPMTPKVPHDPVLDLEFADLETVPAAAGEAVVFDMAVAHGSDLNVSGTPRVAVAVAFAPVEADLSLHFLHVDDDRVEELEVLDPDAFRRIDWRVRPTDLPSLGTVDYDRSEVSLRELIRRSGEVSAPVRDVDARADRRT